MKLAATINSSVVDNDGALPSRITFQTPAFNNLCHCASVLLSCLRTAFLESLPCNNGEYVYR